MFALLGMGGAAGWRLILDAIHRRAAECLALRPGMSVLDVGTGSGRLAVRLGRQVGPSGEVVGIDISEKALREAERRAERTRLTHVHFTRAAAGAGHLGDARFDRAVLVAVLGEIADPPAALADLFRALKPGGLLSVTEVPFDPHRRREDDIRRLTAAAGFVEQNIVRGPLAVSLIFRRPPCRPGKIPV
jgi:ubiquinone/menaquinone biosynthesis C-methylase UbiE